MGTWPDPDSEFLRAQLLEKKGGVATWGPARSGTKEGARRPRIICYGDSNTAGFHNGGVDFQPYGQALASELADAGVPCEIVVCGLSCFTTEDMLNKQNSECVQPPFGPSGRGLARMLDNDGPVDLVIIMTGTNDIGMNTSCRTILQRVSQLHAICHGRGIPTVAIAPTQGPGQKWRAGRQQLADLLAEWAGSTTGVLGFLDVEDLVPRPCGKDGTSSNPRAALHWETDDLHLSASGSIALGRRLAQHVAKLLKSIPSKGDRLDVKRLAKDKALRIPVHVEVFSPAAGAQSPLTPGCGFAELSARRRSQRARTVPTFAAFV